MEVDESFFPRDAAEWGAWLDAHGAAESERWVVFPRKGSGLPGLTWAESVDEALCRGWIDGTRKGLDEQRWAIRFTPRRPDSVWSNVNIKRVGELVELGRMQPAGLEAFARRKESRSGIYSHESSEMPELEPAQEQSFRADPAAWEYFNARPRSYRKVVLRWVQGAKRPETRERRLATLIEDSRHGRTVKHLTRPGG